MAYLNGLYAIILFGGGLMGFLKRGSTASLVASSVFAILYAAAAYLIGSGSPARGHQLSLLASIVLAAVMGFRFFKSFKFMPAGMLFVLAVVMTLRGLVSINGLSAIKGRF